MYPSGVLRGKQIRTSASTCHRNATLKSTLSTKIIHANENRKLQLLTTLLVLGCLGKCSAASKTFINGE